MDSGILKLFRQLQNKSYLKADRKLFIFFIFLIISAFFWFLNALDSNYTTELKYPIKFKNFPDKKIVSNEVPEFVNLKINAKGYIVLRYYLSSTLPPILLDINSFLENRLVKNSTTNVYIVTSLIKEKLEKQLSSELKIIEILPDTINIQLSTTVKKKIPIIANLNLSFKKQFMQSGKLILSPDSIEIIGPSNIIDTIKSISTQEFKINNLDKNIKRNISIIENENIQYSTNRIIIEIPVEKFTESSIICKINIYNKPENVNIKLFPSEIKASFHVTESNYFNINNQSVKFYVDYNDIDSTKKSKLQIKYETLPEIINNFTFQPIFVDYILEK